MVASSDRIVPKWATAQQTVAVLNPLGQDARHRNPALAVKHGND